MKDNGIGQDTMTVKAEIYRTSRETRWSVKSASDRKQECVYTLKDEM